MLILPKERAPHGYLFNLRKKCDLDSVIRIFDKKFENQLNQHPEHALILSEFHFPYHIKAKISK